MIKPIVKDIFFLSQKSESATKQDLPVGQDLMDTPAGQPGPLRRHGGQYDRRKEKNHHHQYGLYECRDV